MGAFQENNHFLKVMALVRKRPGMYMSPLTPQSLRNFIAGYQASMMFRETSQSDLGDIMDCIYRAISQKTGIRRSPAMGWAEMLSTFEDDERGIDIFFECLDECIRDNKT